MATQTCIQVPPWVLLLNFQGVVLHDCQVHMLACQPVVHIRPYNALQPHIALLHDSLYITYSHTLRYCMTACTPLTATHCVTA